MPPPCAACRTLHYALAVHRLASSHSFFDRRGVQSTPRLLSVCSDSFLYHRPIKMEWIERQLQRPVVGFYRSMFVVGFDQYQRLRVFRRLIVCQLIYVVMLEWKNSQEYSSGRSASEWIVIGLVSTTIAEYLAKIRIGWNNFVARAASMVVNQMAYAFAIVACIFFFAIDHRCDSNFIWFLRLLFYYYCYQNVRWFLGIYLSSEPFLFQIRKSIPGQQHPQMLYLIVWQHQDICQLFNAQLMANLPPINDDLDVPDFAWPTMDEAPPWILMKLCENAAMAG